MAIDVKAEARGIAENYFDDGCPANSLAGDIDNLVTRAVAEAKREQMEADCKAVCKTCRDVAAGKSSYQPACINRDNATWGHTELETSMWDECRAHAIRTAFAATEPRDIGKDDARQRFDKAAVRLAKLNEAQMLGLADSHKDRRRGLVHVVLIAAEELGLDGAA